ncbi:PREDICTED: uncharacterized protein LOC104625268 [Phaethon lepturus]|nr:PREDICTED: uncharacterized protein LOC104625268 [Phaethon lepturus]
MLVWQEPVTFEDIAIYLSRAEWDTIAAGQRELYRSVMLDNYQLLTSLGYPGPKPDILYRMEHGEEPWVCTPQSPVKWDGPDSPSPGAVRWRRGHRPPAKGPPSPCLITMPQPERQQTIPSPLSAGRCIQWRLRSRRLLNKFTRLGGRSELPAEASGRGVGPVESQDQARTVFLPAKERQVEDKQEVEANCPLREHDYCRNRKVGVSVLKDHEYCNMQRICFQGRVNKIVGLTGKDRAVLHRLAKRNSQTGRIIRKAKRTLWHYKPCANKRLDFPRSSSSTSHLSESVVPPAKAEDDPTKGTCEAFHSAKQETLPLQPQSEGTSQGVTSDALCMPVVSFEPVAAPPPSNGVVEVKREVTHPIHRKVQRARLIRSPDAKQKVEGHELVNSNYISLHDAYKIVMRTVDHMLDSVCQNFELGGYSQRKDIWPIVIQIDS